MACHRPWKAWVPPKGGGRPSMVERPGSRLVELPCGTCNSCRDSRAREWASRCVLEASRHRDNSFLTLTYSDQHLPPAGPDGHTLRSGDLQKFWKRLRKRTGVALKYLACGEYGDLSRRPHYHALVFGYRPQDLVFYKRSGDSLLFTSKFLEDVWSFGFVTVGDVTAASSAYVSRYVMKKAYGAAAQERYANLEPEFLRCSHGLGAGHLSQVNLHDRVSATPGVYSPTPRYYLKKLEAEGSPLFSELKEQRRRSALERSRRHKPSLESEAAVLAAKLKLSRRSL